MSLYHGGPGFRKCVLLAALFACDEPPAAPRERADPACSPSRAIADRLPRVRAEHETLDYWLARVPDPDRVLLGVDDIASMRRSPARFDLREPPDEVALLAAVRARVGELRPKLEEGDLVRDDGSRCPRAALDALHAPPARGLVGELRIATAPLAIRCTPLRAPFYSAPPHSTPVDRAFDRNLCSTAAPLEPIELLRRWPNGSMLVRTPYVFGFIDSTDSLSPAADRERWLGPPSVFLRAPAEICGASLPSGTRLPVEDGARVMVARRTEFCDAPLPAVAASTWAPLRRSELLRVAFSYLGTPYGWAGEGGVDCSSFLQLVFSRFSIELPRNSADQVEAASDTLELEGLAPHEKLARIEEAHRDGVVLLELPGHIMLYLGSSEAGPRVLHALADYVEPCGDGDEATRRVRRVVVSDLGLGEGTSRGSLLDRVRRAAVFSAIGAPATSPRARE